MNPLLFELRQIDFPFSMEDQIKAWDKAAVLPNFPEILVDAVANANQDICSVLNVISEVLMQHDRPDVDKHLPTIGMIIDGLKTSNQSLLSWSHLWLDVMCQYAQCVGVGSDAGVKVVSKIREVAFHEAFAAGHHNFFGVINGFAMRQNPAAGYAAAMAGIWKDLVGEALSKHCLGSPNHAVGGPYISDGMMAIPSIIVLNHIRRNVAAVGAIGDATRELMAQFDPEQRRRTALDGPRVPPVKGAHID